jgi:hypothetical protein
MYKRTQQQHIAMVWLNPHLARALRPMARERPLHKARPDSRAPASPARVQVSPLKPGELWDFAARMLPCTPRRANPTKHMSEAQDALLVSALRIHWPVWHGLARVVSSPLRPE